MAIDLWPIVNSRQVAIAKDDLRHGKPLAPAPREHQLPQRHGPRRAETQGAAPGVAEGHDAHRHRVGWGGGNLVQVIQILD